MSVGKRLKELRICKNMTQLEMGDMLDIPQSNLYRYESDVSKLTTEKLEKIHQLGVNVNWLITGEGEMFRNNNPSTNTLIEDLSVIKIPMIDVKASAGQGMVNYIEDIKDFISLPENILPAYTNKKNLAIIEIMGDSMEPTIKNGEIVILDTGVQEIRSGSVYLIRVFDDLRVKRIDRKMNGNIVIMSDNAVYPPEELAFEELENSPLHIIGIIILSMHSHVGRASGIRQVR